MTFHIHKIPEVESGRSLFLLLDPLQQHNPPPPSPPSSLSLLGLDWNNCLFFAEEKEALHEVSSKQQPSSIAGRRHRHSSTLPACLPAIHADPSLPRSTWPNAAAFQASPSSEGSIGARPGRQFVWLLLFLRKVLSIGAQAGRSFRRVPFPRGESSSFRMRSYKC